MSQAAPLVADAGAYVTVDVARLRAGTTLFAPLYDTRDVLLLAEGQTVTDAFLGRLKDRAIRTIRAHDRDVDRSGLPGFDGPVGTAKDVPPDRPGTVSTYRNEVSDRLDAEICLGRIRMPDQGTPVISGLKRLGARPYDAESRSRLVESYNKTVTRLGQVYEQLAGGGGLDRTTLDEVTDQALDDVGEDTDLFVSLSGNQLSGGYPVRHSVNTAMLALAVGIQLELDEPTLRELVIGCLIHDAGMLLLDRSVYDHAGSIDGVRFLEITKHPILVFDVLKDSDSIPKRSAFIAYQMHERCDGSGYPRRRAGNQIHFLSKIAGLADAYVALVSPRAHRPAMMPYHAMEKVLRDANRGLFDCSVVRALLRTVSLFPIGSCVELCDGRRGCVIRAGSDYTRPIVELGGSGSSTGETVDLSAVPDVSVARALPALPVGG